MNDPWESSQRCYRESAAGAGSALDSTIRARPQSVALGQRSATTLWIHAAPSALTKRMRADRSAPSSSKNFRSVSSSWPWCGHQSRPEAFTARRCGDLEHAYPYGTLAAVEWQARRFSLSRTTTPSSPRRVRRSTRGRPNSRLHARVPSETRAARRGWPRSTR